MVCKCIKKGFVVSFNTVASAVAKRCTYAVVVINVI